MSDREYFFKKGNQYGKKDNPKCDKIEVRCTPAQKENIKHVANALGLTMSEHILKASGGK